ncbi:hypothetical protein AVEN_14056-1 [Araneus ventricosus]|uniref:Uncharacterized protein n=1 Tax=Araneus ventricosus TaxID=182803 RepID=A0A4Y2NFL5_ARAVE|nr:hypothetical protein AVEN_14056-1 [Araneus ventricosus]
MQKEGYFGKGRKGNVRSLPEKELQYLFLLLFAVFLSNLSVPIYILSKPEDFQSDFSPETKEFLICGAKTWPRRNRLSDSLRRRVVGWLEMVSSSQADAPRHLNVSNRKIPKRWNQFQQNDSATRRPIPGRPFVTTPCDGHYLLLSA